MRVFIRAAVAVVVLVAAYWGWALVGAAELASAASHGDVEAVMRRVDLPALTRSLSAQVAHAFLDQNPQFKKLLSVEQGFVGSLGAGAAEALMREILTPQNIAALLAEGRAGFPNSASAISGLPSFGDAFRNGLPRAVTHSYFDAPLSFVVPLDGADGRYAVHLHLSGATWRLSGLDIPEDLSGRLAREIAARVNGSAERPGG